MSASLQGYVLREARGDIFCPVQDVLDLTASHHQDQLSDHHYSSRMPYCGCGLEQGIERSLIVHRLPKAKTEADLTLFCQEQAQHPPTCWLSQAGEGRSEDELYNSAIFRLPTLANPDAPLQTSSHYQGLFSRFIRFSSASAQCAAMVAANQNWRHSGFRRFRLADFFEALHSELCRPLFPGGSAYVAAKNEGAKLSFGLIEQDAIPCTDASGYPVNVLEWKKGMLCSRLVVVAPDVWNAALGSIRMMNGEQPGPYFFAKAEDENGYVHRLRLFACFTDGSSFFTSDSGGESGFAKRGCEHSAVLFKPLRRTDMAELFIGMGIPVTIPAGGFRYLPDFLVFRLVAGNWRCSVVELRGFEPGKIPAYDRHFEEKLRYFDTFHLCIRGVERRSVDYPRPKYDPLAIRWAGLRSGIFPDSRAMVKWSGAG